MAVYLFTVDDTCCLKNGPFCLHLTDICQPILVIFGRHIL